MADLRAAVPRIENPRIRDLMEKLLNHTLTEGEGLELQRWLQLVLDAGPSALDSSRFLLTMILALVDSYLIELKHARAKEQP